MEKQKNIDLLNISKKIIKREDLAEKDINAFKEFNQEDKRLIKDLILSNINDSTKKDKDFFLDVSKKLEITFVNIYMNITGENKSEEIEKILADKSALDELGSEKQAIINIMTRVVIFEGDTDKIKRTIDYVQSL